MNYLEARLALANHMKRKYRNKPVVVDGQRFDSQREYARHCELELLQRAGAIWDLRRQVIFPLVVNYTKVGSIKPDWAYVESDGTKVAEDSKGFQTDVHKLRWKLAQVLFPDWDWRLT